ncbi:FAD/NAD(P)-binding domain-containing protein, partial [Byssothecium circinans]
TVAIIGAGPAGLVTAATLLQTQQFHIKILEKTSEIGGLWSPNGLIDPAMTANLCQSTVSFAGLSWESIGTQAPIYPKARHVTRYLQEYYHRYIPDGTVVFDTEVTRAELESADRSGLGHERWKITTTTRKAEYVETKESMFDYLVVASGPFSHPQKASDFASEDLLRTSKIPIIHSTKYRSLADIKTNTRTSWNPGSKILVVGGSHSGSEIASKIALELSTLAANEQTQPELLHLTSRKLFALSPLLPTARERGKDVGFEPADFKLYNRSSRPHEAPVSFTYGLFDSEKHAAGVKMMKHLSGHDSALGEKEKEEESHDLQLSAVISESYAQLVAFGLIKPIPGRLLSLHQTPQSESEDQTLTATITSHSSAPLTITNTNISGVVHATGFNAAASVSFLDSSTLTKIGYDPVCQQFPFLLDASYLSQNAKVPTLAVIGFATQYWGVMEMQARAIAAAWVTGIMCPSPEDRAGIMDYSLALREAIKSRDAASIPPNPFGDYVGLVEQAARELRLERVDGVWSATEGPVCPARYVARDASDQKREAVKAVSKLQGLLHASYASTAFTVRAVFYGLLGRWGISNGTAGTGHDDVDVPSASAREEIVFRPRLGGSVDAGLDFEYLVIKSSSSDKETLNREIYRHREGTDYITIWSASAE